MKGKWSYIEWGLFACLTVVLLVLLQQEFRYHFYFIEQNFMFQFSPDYICSGLAIPGGAADLIGEFLIQFFLFPYAGALITTALIALIALLTNAVLRRMNPAYHWLLPACIPALSLLFLHFDFNYRQSGTVAFLFMLFALWGVIRINSTRLRFAYHVVSIIALYWLGGAVYVLYILIAVLYEFTGQSRLRYWSLAFIPFALLLAEAALRMAWIGEYRLILLPDMFYHSKLEPKMVIYFGWLAFLLLCGVALGLKPVKEKNGLAWGSICVSLVLVVVFAGWGVREYGDQKAKQVKMLDYFSRTGQWDEIIRASQGRLTNYLYLCYLNRALAEKEWLGERMFLFDQRGVEGLLLKWNKTSSISVLLSDVYFTIGNIAIAQEMAFEAYISATGGGNPRMLKRLVETNLIFGEYKVAEKYIDLLDKTVYYKEWANGQRRFLYNDEAVEQDPLLGEKRRGLLVDSYLSNTKGMDKDLLNMAVHYPANRTPIEYLGGLLLLAKDMQGFQSLLDTYYGTDVLPALPHGFQEAVIILFEQTPEAWSRYGLDKSVIGRFGHYRKAILANKNNKALPQLMARDYGNTYWFYFMFK